MVVGKACTRAAKKQKADAIIANKAEAIIVRDTPTPTLAAKRARVLKRRIRVINKAAKKAVNKASKKARKK